KIIDTQTEATNFFNASTASTTDKALTGYYKLGKDLTVTSNYKYDRYFANGTFDGDGHTLTVTMTANHYVGLFGRMSNVTVKNLQINMTKDFSSSTSSRAQRDCIFGYQSTTANHFENVQLNLSRAEGDTDANYSANNYPSLYLIGSTEKSTAKNVVINIADGTLIYPDTIVSISLLGFVETSGTYMFSEDYELMKASDGAWGKFDTSIASAVESGERFYALTGSNYWTLDTENKNIVFGKVVIGEEEIPDEETGSAYTPVVRFVVTSDVHIRRYDLMDGQDQLENMYGSAYAFANNSEINSGYNKLDGVFVVGDLTNYEVDYEYPLFFDCVNANTREGTLSRAVMGNHEFSQLVYSGNGNSWANADTIKTATDKFLAASGYESEDYHTVINGYHFIFVSMDRYGKSSGTQYEYISPAKLEWLKTQLDAAVADDPTGDKPIFVFQHVHVKDTVGSSSNGDGYLRELLDQYPNVVDFSGHTHKPVPDPRSIWQETFTAINTGSLAYLSQNIRETGYGAKAVNDKGEWASNLEAENTMRDGGLYYICEIDANNVMRIHVYDLFSDSVFGEPIILDSFGDTSGFDYTADRETKSVAPEFATTDEITVEKNAFNRTDITFPQATGDDLVENYRIEIYQNGELFKTEYRLSGVVYGNAMPEKMSVTLAGLSPATTYTLKVYAINYWLKVSAPLVKEFTTAELTTIAPDIAAITFNETGGVDALGGNVVKKGASGVAYDEDLGAYVGALNANGAYAALNLADWYSTLKCGFTLETYVKVTDTPAKKYALIGNNDDGGFALYYTSAGNYNFICEFGETEYSASAAGATGEWTHVVCVYDGSALKLYLNGELVATTNVTETYRPPRLLSNYLLVGADPYYVNNGYEYPCKANMETANLYGYALTEEQVQTLYQNQ
ncbi:MAG: metallophosphoesterase, partial [Clostridia bacterium]|nr:metallophosphoesterase [Clostridia bacterium]